MPLGWKPQWGNKLSRPITLRNGTTLHTLRDARALIVALPRTRHSPQWEIAATRLVAAAENGSALTIATATRALELALEYDANFVMTALDPKDRGRGRRWARSKDGR
jgi:hypothetical protein